MKLIRILINLNTLVRRNRIFTFFLVDSERIHLTELSHGFLVPKAETVWPGSQHGWADRRGRD